MTLKYWTALMLLSLCSNLSADEAVDVEFLEWLGQTSDLAEMGVDVDLLIENHEDDKDQADSEAEEQ